MSKGIDLLIISPNEAEPLTPVVEEIFNKGIPVLNLVVSALKQKWNNDTNLKYHDINSITKIWIK